MVCPIPLSTWEKFYDSVYPQNNLNVTNFIDIRHPFLDKDFSYQEVKKAITKSKSRKSLGPSIYKKGTREDPDNYRGIALLNNLLKLLTSILQNRLSIGNEDLNIVPEEQTGFKKGRSCRD